jgi:hypothetical protein
VQAAGDLLRRAGIYSAYDVENGVIVGALSRDVTAWVDIMTLFPDAVRASWTSASGRAIKKDHHQINCVQIRDLHRINTAGG